MINPIGAYEPAHGLPQRPVATLMLVRDSRLDPERREQTMRIHHGAAGSVVVSGVNSDGERFSFAIDAIDVRRVVGALQDAAARAQKEWGETMADFAAVAAIERARQSSSRMQWPRPSQP